MANPSEVKVTMAQVELLIAQNKTDKAMQVLNRALENFPTEAAPARYLALLLHQKGEHDRCCEVLERALARVEKSEPRREVAILLADLYTKYEQDKKAYKTLMSLSNELPDDLTVKRRLLSCRQAIETPARLTLHRLDR